MRPNASQAAGRLRPRVDEAMLLDRDLALKIAPIKAATPCVDDGSQVSPLLDQATVPIASFTGGGAYDRDDVSDTVEPDAGVRTPKARS